MGGIVRDRDVCIPGFSRIEQLLVHTQSHSVYKSIIVEND